MSAEASTSEVLNKAADLIEERGWTNGESGWDWQDSEDSPLCLEGGMLAALGIPADEAGALSETLRSCPSYIAVQQYLVEAGDLGPSEHLWRFNDESKAERVIGALRATARSEAARERESVEV